MFFQAMMFDISCLVCVQVHRQLLAAVEKAGHTARLPTCAELEAISQHINKKHRVSHHLPTRCFVK